ncbi:type III secretion pore protein [Croceibacterium mercuriale]|uniref:Type III secretion pore protein n=1 Tax=Croceibacterium mercuriale TaxID=1572751 RepID=A0A0B2BZD6_9SPHN|nr:flagellar biosynthesis protein FlhA [Croceibacterium mercuriale]KHL25220.1 type III secretion pore protein [Croceibacterium mercuriale]
MAMPFRLAAALRGRPALPFRGADTVLVLLIAMIVALLIVPMPAMVMDLLIGVNIAIGLLLILGAMYVVKPLDFSTFPTVLLLTTLFRLSVSIATTRLILTHAEGGKIVEQFGRMVSGGNLVVGLVVFLIITLVQFIVISKGAERVAEVAARFSLDAMPGKQLSIDSDLRSGLLGKDEARAKRHMLEQESKFHGSLDGAMKFVKGDAIASLVIVIVNLLGGLAVGALYHDMDLATAVSTFSILTIGDGLAAQIPALFAAMAAGLLVTRTTDETAERDLGPAIARQIVGKPHVLFIAAGLCLLLALVPGFPTLTFLGIAFAMVAGGVWQTPLLRDKVGERLGLSVAQPVNGGELTVERRMLEPVAPLTVAVLLPVQTPAILFGELSTEIRRELEMIGDEAGVRMPTARILRQPLAAEPASDLPPAWQIDAYGAPLGSGSFGAAGDRPAGPVGETLRRHLPLFLGLQEVTDMLNWLGEEYPEVVKEAVRSLPTSVIAEVLRMLADEGVSLRNLRDIVQALAQAGQTCREPAQLLQMVRPAIRRQIVAPLVRDGRLAVMMVGSAAEASIRQTLTEVEGTQRLAITPLQMRNMIDLIERETVASGAAALLTARDLRRPMRLLLAGDLHHLPVLAFNELVPSIPLDIVAEMNWAPPALDGHRELEEAA